MANWSLKFDESEVRRLIRERLCGVLYSLEFHQGKNRLLSYDARGNKMQVSCDCIEGSIFQVSVIAADLGIEHEVLESNGKLELKIR